MSRFLRVLRTWKDPKTLAEQSAPVLLNLDAIEMLAPSEDGQRTIITMCSTKALGTRHVVEVPFEALVDALREVERVER